MHPESAEAVCPPHAPDQLLLLPGQYTLHQAARRCRSLGGELPYPEDSRMASLVSMVGDAPLLVDEVEEKLVQY